MISHKKILPNFAKFGYRLDRYENAKSKFWRPPQLPSKTNWGMQQILTELMKKQQKSNPTRMHTTK